MFTDCCGLGEVFEGNRDVPIADTALLYAPIEPRGFTDAEIIRQRKTCQFLRSDLSSEVDRGIMLRAKSSNETWRNLKSSHSLKFISPTQALHDRFQTNSMKPGQYPFVALTALQEMASHFSQQCFSVAPNQPLIQFLSILPELEYEVENRTFCNGLQADRKQVLLAIRSQFENLQCQRKKGGGMKDAGDAFGADAEGRPGGERYSSSDARGLRKGRRGCDRGGHRNHKNSDGGKQRKVEKAKGDNAKCKRSGETRDTIYPPADLIRSAVCVMVMVVWLRSAQTSSLLSCLPGYQGLQRRQ